MWSPNGQICHQIRSKENLERYSWLKKKRVAAEATEGNPEFFRRTKNWWWDQREFSRNGPGNWREENRVRRWKIRCKKWD